MVLQLAVEIEHRVAGFVESRQEFVHDDDNLRLVAVLEAVDDARLVLFGRAVFIHHALPESHLHVRGLAECFVFPLPGVGRGDEHLRRDDADFVEKLLVENRDALARSHQLRLELRPLPVLPEVLRNVPRNGVDALLCLVELVRMAELLLHVGPLGVAHPSANLVEIAVNRLLVYHLRHHAPLVQQRHDGLVRHGLIHRVDRLDDAAELPGRVLLLLHQRRAGHGDEAGIRERLLHLDAHLAVLAAVPLVDQHEDVGVGQRGADAANGRLELVDNRRDDGIALAVEQFDELASCRGVLDANLTLAERPRNLPVEVRAVGHEDDFRIANLLVEDDGLRQHHHRQRLAAPLRVPDDAAAPPPALDVADAPHRLPHGKILLVTRHLLDAVVVERETVHQLQQPLGPAEVVEVFVLHRRGDRLFVELLEVAAHVAEPLPEELVVQQRLVDHPLQLLPVTDLLLAVGELLAPPRPELFGRGRRGVTPLLAVDGQQQRRVEVQRTDAVGLLVAEVLRNGLLDGVLHVGTLALDDAERNAVHEEDDVGPVGVGHPRAADGKLLGNVEDVVARILPVDVLHHEALAVAVDNLFEGFARGEQVVDRLRSLHEPLVHRDVAQGVDSGGDVLLGEYGGAHRADLHDVDGGELFAQHGFEQHVGEIPAAQGQRLIGCEVCVTELFEHQQRGDLADMVFFEGNI